MSKPMVKPRAARVLRDVRERLRDAAATTHAAATAHTDRAAGQLAIERDRLGATMAGAAVGARPRAVGQRARARARRRRRQPARSPTHAAAHHLEALVAAAATGDALRERARQLRTAERIVELVDKSRNDAEAKRERIACDDLAARRK